MHKLTVYTPTFNRDHLLPRLYKNLQEQTCKEFIWMIIDDGSTDNTRNLVNSWINEKILKIKYIYKDNGGVHTARDTAYENIQTELLVGIDSDDLLTKDAIKIILDFWEMHGDEMYAGIFSRTCLPDGKPYGPIFPKKKALTYQQFTYKYKYKSEKHTILRTKIIKNTLRYPVFNDEKLIGEGYKWIQLPNDKKFLLLNKFTRIFDMQDDGYSRNSYRNFFKFPKGARENHKMHIIHSKYLSARIKGYIGYILFSLYLKDKKFIKNSPKPLATILLTPLGLIAFIYAIFKYNYS
jgi:glycosyltransferase involved in cell wall biosynthesis